MTEREQHLFKWGVFNMAVDLRQQSNGAADPWPDEVVAEVKAYLRKRLAEWRPGPTWCARFDNAVREAVEAALEEVEWQEQRTAEARARRRP